MLSALTMTGDIQADPSAQAEADDASLIRAYAERRDREALGLLFRRHSDLAYRTAFRVLKDASEAEDAVQAAFVEIMRDAAAYRGGQGARVWMMKIVTNICRNMIKKSVRRRGREERALGDSEEMAARADVVGELTDLVKMALDRLPEQYRLPIWLHHYEGLPFEEVAEVLSIPSNTVRSYASRGIAELKKSLARTVAAVPSASIVTALAAIPGEAAPATLVNSIGDLVAGVGEFSKAALAAKGLGAARGAGMGTGVKVAIGVGLAAAFLAVVGTLRPSRRPATPAVLPAVPPPAAAWSHGWNFNSPDVPAALVPDVGSWHYVPGGGPDGSGCMQTDTDLFSVTLNIPVEALPAVVSWRAGVVYKPGVKDDWTCAANWKAYSGGALLHGMILMKTHRIPAAPGQVAAWGDYVAYVSEQGVIQGRVRELGNVALVQRAGQAPLQALFRGPHRIDDLAIRSARPDEMPDLRPYLNAIEKIPPDQRKGTVPLPDLKPAPGQKQVTAEFFGPNG